MAMFDAVALIAALKAEDPDALKQAYQMTFGTEWGRLVLAHILAEAGVGRTFGGQADAVQLAYHQGAHDGALKILEHAGMSPGHAVLLSMTGELEGPTDEHATFAEPDPEFD